MANVLANNACMTSFTNGTGTLTLVTNVTGRLTFAQAGVANGAVVSYSIQDYDTSGNLIASEQGEGTYTSASLTLTRTTVRTSTSAGAKIDCTGRQQVAIMALKEDFDTFLTDDDTGASGHKIPYLDVQNTFSENQLIVKASANMNIVASSGDATQYIAAISGQAATARWTHWNGSAVVDRWLFGKDAIAETGSDAGSAFAVYYYDDAGTFKNVFFTCSRAGSGDANYYVGLRSNGVTGGNKGAGTLNFGTIYEEGASLAAKYARIAAINTFTENQLIVKASANFNIVSSSGNTTQYIAAVAGNSADTRWTHWNGSAVVDRWLFGKSVAAESGSDAGSNLDCYSYTDAGTFKNTILRFTRAGDINFFQGIRSNGVTGGNQGAGTANFTTLYEAGTSLASKYARLSVANVYTLAQTVRIDDAGTNSVTVGATLSHTTSGTPAAGIGVSLAFEAETAAANNEVGATIEAVTTDVTAGSEDFDLVFKTMAAGAAAAEKGRMKSTGTYKMPSFTVAGLPAGTAGEISFASNGRKNGEGAGLGTGVLVFHDGTNWCASDTGVAVAA